MLKEKLNKMIAGMKPSRYTEIPKCNFCEKTAEVDGPTLTGQWGYMCSDCIIDKADVLAVVHIGMRLEKRPIQKINDDLETYNVIEVTSLDDSLSGDRIVECPHCHYSHAMEWDASGDFRCHDCGVMLHIEARI